MLKHFVSVGFYTLISRITGYLRDLVIAYFFGASVFSDAFFAAFRLPNLFRAIFGEGALTAAFLPLYNQLIKQNGKTRAEAFATYILIILMIALLVLCLLAYAFMPFLVNLLTPGYGANSETIELIINLSYILFPYIVLASLMSFFGSILNSFRVFWVFASAPIILNIVMIISLLIAGDEHFKVISLSYSVLIGGVLEVFWCLYFLKSRGMKFRLKFKNDLPLVKFFKRLGPAVLGSSVVQINVFLSTILASFTVSGISYLYYADRIYQLPLALIGTALASVLLPTISSAIASSKLRFANAVINKAISFSFLIILPISVLSIVLAKEIIILLFLRGEFDITDVINTADALKLFSLALPAFVVAKIFYTSFFANGDTKTPLYASLTSLVVNFSIAIILLKLIGFLSVPFGAVCGAYVNVIILYVVAINKGVIVGKIPKDIFKYLSASIVMFLVASFVLANLNFASIYNIILTSSIAIFAYCCCLFILKINVVSEFKRLKRIKAV